MPLSLPSRTLRLALVITPILSTTASATTLHVPGDYPTIQAAIDAAVSGDSIRVEPGDYGEDIVIAKKRLVILAAGDATSTALRSIEGTPQGLVAGFTIHAGVRVAIFEGRFDIVDCTLRGDSYIDVTGPEDELAGAMVRGCLVEGDIGGSAYFGWLDLIQCTIRDCNVNLGGEEPGSAIQECSLRNCDVSLGGDLCELSRCVVDGGSVSVSADWHGSAGSNRITNSLLSLGGFESGFVDASENELINTMLFADGNVSIDDNVIRDVDIAISVEDWEFDGRAYQEIDGNLIWDCSTGIRVKDRPETLMISGNTIVGCSVVGILIDTSASYAGVLEANLVVSCDSGVSIPPGVDGATIGCNDVWKNVTNWEGIADPTGIDGNISADPLFCDRANDVFTLRPRSPCLPGASPCGRLIGALGQGCDGPTLTPPTSSARATLVRHVGPRPSRGPVTFELDPSASAGPVALAIFDARGRLVGRQAVDGQARQIVWDGRDSQGRAAPSGVYFYTLRSDGVESSGRLEVMP